MRNDMSATRGCMKAAGLWRDAGGAGAVEFGLGVRLAAVSNPVSSDLTTMTGVGGTVEEGDPMPYFKRVCSGASQTCSNGGTYSAAAMRTILYGRGNASCPTTAQAYPAM